MKTSLFVTSFYCMNKGHSVRNYNIRKFDVSKVRWVLEHIVNSVGPKFNRGLLPWI